MWALFELVLKILGAFSFVARSRERVADESLPRLVIARVFRALDEPLAEVFFGRELVVRATAQGDVLCGVLATPSERSQMVELEPVRLPATLSCLIAVGAAPLVTREDRSANGGGHVSSALARVLLLGLGLA